MSKVTDIARDLVLPILENYEMELVDIEYVKEGKDWFLRVYIDKESGVNIEDCGIVSEQLSTKLDEIDPIRHNYFLEVSSPGAERPLKNKADFKKAIGRNVNINTYAPVEGDKVFEGKLLDVAEETVTIEIMIKTRRKQIDIPFDMIANARLAVSFS